MVSSITCVLKLFSEPRRLLRVIWVLSPLIGLICSFGAFVLWNGSVVLGDKSNHVATLHLPQMLYIWPYVVFFSWPIVYHYLLILPIGHVGGRPLLSRVEALLMFKRRVRLPDRRYTLVFGLLAAVVVRYNTIVHPFTLADNRHYTFYVFRLLTRRWWVRYAATPVYVVCAWACLQVLGDSASASSSRTTTTTTTATSSSRRDRTPVSTVLPDGQRAATVSFVLIWLTASATQLVTAPLVEPRYFILPWIFWRLHVPTSSSSSSSSSPPPSSDTSTSNDKAGGAREALAVRVKRVLWDRHDHRLWLETAWFLAVNAVTGHIFLNWGFQWPSEPGNVQRFMW